MKMKSIAGINCYVKDLNKTANFYETLGFRDKKERGKPYYDLLELVLDRFSCYRYRR